MILEDFLKESFYFLAATLTFVPLFKWLRLGPVLGYIAAGVLIGPMGLKLISDSNSIFQLAELGIILLLFVVGLEVSPRKLRALKKNVFVDGTFQFIVTALLFTAAGLAFNLDFNTSLVLGFVLSLSSTAFALQYLKETSQSTLSYGQSSLGILLFQDIIIVPLLLIIPFLSQEKNILQGLDTNLVLTKSLILAGLIVLGHFVFKPLIKFILKGQGREIFTAACLLIIIGMSLAMGEAGFSKALGAFLAGVFLADSDIRSDIEQVILPYKGMLMGLFFMTFGLKIDLFFFKEHFLSVVGLCLSFLVLKLGILLLIGKNRTDSWSSGLKLGLIVCQGGEFGLVLLSRSLETEVIGLYHHNLLFSTIALSIALAPLIVKIVDFVPQQKTSLHLVKDSDEEAEETVEQEADFKQSA